MKLSVGRTDIHVLNVRTRMPFKYGIATMTALPHVLVRVELAMDGEVQSGLAADGLPPKWFTKDPATDFLDDLADMFAVLRSASRIAMEARPSESLFALWRSIYQKQYEWGTEQGYPPLLWGFGVSLVERAMIDAFCRATHTSFSQAIRENTMGIRLREVYPELADSAPADWLPGEPLRRIVARHTVGLADPLTDDEIATDERIEDGLPQSLVACIREYGLTHFKIKILGDAAKDMDRLARIARILDETAPADYRVTIDGNEQYREVDAFARWWTALTDQRPLDQLLEHLLFVEQPLHRAVALDPEVKDALQGWSDRPPMMIDESDGSIESLKTALDCGYVGTSHKNCKGVFKGIINACLVEYHRRAEPGRRYLMSGEDLANMGPVALLQDFAVLATLGIDHAERNGHHYFSGLSMFPEDVQEAVLAHHGDLYRRHERGFATLNLVGGSVSVRSVVEAPFGTGFVLDPARFTPLHGWSFASLGF